MDDAEYKTVVLEELKHLGDRVTEIQATVDGILGALIDAGTLTVAQAEAIVAEASKALDSAKAIGVEASERLATEQALAERRALGPQLVHSNDAERPESGPKAKPLGDQ